MLTEAMEKQPDTFDEISQANYGTHGKIFAGEM